MSIQNQPREMISVVTPTLNRPAEISELLENILNQEHLPTEIIIVDAAEAGDDQTENIVNEYKTKSKVAIIYTRFHKGTAIQRNHGIQLAHGDFIAFIDDDIRLDPSFFVKILDVFRSDQDHKIGGVVGYRTNNHFTPETAVRWRWYRRLGLLSTFEPGRYDYKTGYPINANLQPAFQGIRPVDFMTTACAVWRREVFTDGLRFDPIFKDYGVLEDAHFSLRAKKLWNLVQCGDAHCLHLHSPHGRVNRKKLGYKCVVNYYYTFQSIAGPLSFQQKYRFWRYQLFELFRIAMSAIRRFNKEDLLELGGRLDGFIAIASRRAF